MLSGYCRKIADTYGIKVCGVKILVTNSGNKSKYVAQYGNRQLYLSPGMKLTKIPRILKFKQCDWLKKYIDFNTDRSKNAGNIFEKDFFELIINRVYGKTMEKLRKRINVRLVNNDKNHEKYASKPSFVPRKIFSKHFVANS